MISPKSALQSSDWLVKSLEMESLIPQISAKHTFRIISHFAFPEGDWLISDIWNAILSDSISP